METDMTREEAIKEIKSWDFLNEKETEAIETLIPELHESDDERIINQLITLVNSTGEILLIPTNKEELVAWLNKCKESLYISETCKEKADSFTDEDKRIRKWIASYIHRGVFDEEEHPKALMAIEWLEKQKENPKSADSIPSDCTADVKCKNRWHKVGDSLPDNGREVLAKDKLGNILLAKYDGEGWDVSVYDDEDYRCHNGISKWCEIPSEKQKEQKPAEIHIDNPNLQKFDPDVKVTTSDSSADGKELLYVSNKSYDIGFRDGVASAKKEWSKEDNIGWDEALACVTKTEKTAKNEEELQNAVTAEKWLKEIKFKYYVHPIKQEWSEEDEEMRGTCIDLLEHFPRPCGEVIGPWKDCIVWLKSLRPQPHWKPSDEQMEAPDKIFINEDVIALHILQTKYDGDIEYIRKDALLGWIKEQLAENTEWREVNPYDRFFGGKEVAFNRIIDKINSL